LRRIIHDVFIYSLTAEMISERLWLPKFADEGVLIDKEGLEEGFVQFDCVVNSKPVPQIAWYVN